MVPVCYLQHKKKTFKHRITPPWAPDVVNLTRSGTTTGFYLYTGKASVVGDRFTCPGADQSKSLRKDRAGTIMVSFLIVLWTKFFKKTPLVIWGVVNSCVSPISSYKGWEEIVGVAFFSRNVIADVVEIVYKRNLKIHSGSQYKKKEIIVRRNCDSWSERVLEAPMGYIENGRRCKLCICCAAKLK